MTHCTGHSFIQNLLAKSVVKINALYPSSKNKNVDEIGTITNSSKKRQQSEKCTVLNKQKMYEEKHQNRRIKVKQYKMETEYTEYDADADLPDEKYIKEEAAELTNKSNKKKRKSLVDDGNVKKKDKKNIKQEQLKFEIKNIKTEIKTEDTATSFTVPYTKLELKEECSVFNNKLSSLKKIKDEQKLEEQKVVAAFIEQNLDEDNNDAEDEYCHIRKFRKRTTSNQVKKLFKPHEDEILRKAMEKFGNQISIGSLAKELNRSHASVRSRITKIKTGDIRKMRKPFSLAEDLVIMDKVLDNLHGQNLANINLHNGGTSLEVATALGRMEVSARIRWGIILKPWILQHFSGTLNLEVRRMLANFIADNFDTTNSIDWQLVAERPDFVGHTRESIRSIFFSQLFPSTRKHLRLESKDITLKNIADFANDAYVDNFCRISEKVLTRQKQVINYFEQYVKEHGITEY